MRQRTPNYPPRGVVGRHDESFNDVLYHQLRRTPWYVVSVALHGVVLGVLWSMSFVSIEPRDDIEIHASQTVEAPEPLVEPEPLPDPVTPHDETIPEPDDTDIPTPVDTVEDTDDPFDEAKGEDGSSDAPLDGRSTNDLIGPGGGAGSKFGQRGGDRVVDGGGGTARTEGAVVGGLEWLKNHQDPEGYWDCDGFDAQCKLNRCDGKGQALYDPGVSGLALLAFLGAGETHKDGQYKETVKRGLQYLKQAQDPEGCFGNRTGHFTYNHATAALAMTEAYGMTGSPLFKNSAQRGIDFIHRAQNPYLAWRYDVRPQDNDTSVTGWMIMALKSAKTSGLRVSQDGFDGAKAWLDKVTEPEYGKVGYTARGNGPARPAEIMDRFPADKSESLTAVGMLTRVFIGENPKTSDAIQKGVDLCLKALPEWDEASGSIDMYYWYYGTLAMFQVGGAPWKAWNDSMKTAIVDTQRKSGDEKGSWDPKGPWGADGGRVYSTALNTMCLEVYYRYARVFGSGRK